MTGIDARTDQERARLPCFAESQASKRCVVSWSRPEFAALIRTIPVTAARTEKGVARSSVQSRTCNLLAPEGGYARSEERRVGKEWVSTCRSRWSPYHYKKKQ